MTADFVSASLYKKQRVGFQSFAFFLSYLMVKAEVAVGGGESLLGNRSALVNTTIISLQCAELTGIKPLWISGVKIVSVWRNTTLLNTNEHTMAASVCSRSMLAETVAAIA